MYKPLIQTSSLIIILTALATTLSLSYTNVWAAANNDPIKGMTITAGSFNQPGQHDKQGPQGPPGPTPGPWIYLTFDSCSGTNGNHDVTCNVHDETDITQLTCTVADPAISGGVNVGMCTTNNGKHLQCTIPPQPGVFGCNLQS